MNWETLLAWGDSITIGARSYLAYTEHAGNFLREETGKQWHTPVHAVCGYTACDLNRSLTPELNDQKLLNPSLLTLMIGTNDLKSPTDPNSFKIAYRQLLIKASLICPAEQILVLHIPHLKTGVMYPYQMSMNETVNQFNDIIDELVLEFGTRSMHVQLKSEDLYDGVHLSETGALNVGRQIADFVLMDRGIVSKKSNKNATHTNSPIFPATQFSQVEYVESNFGN